MILPRVLPALVLLAWATAASAQQDDPAGRWEFFLEQRRSPGVPGWGARLQVARESVLRRAVPRLPPGTAAMRAGGLGTTAAASCAPPTGARAGPGWARASSPGPGAGPPSRASWSTRRRPARWTRPRSTPRPRAGSSSRPIRGSAGRRCSTAWSPICWCASTTARRSSRPWRAQLAQSHSSPDILYLSGSGTSTLTSTS